MSNIFVHSPHLPVFEYDGAFKCFDCGATWGALPDHPEMPATCVSRRGKSLRLDFECFKSDVEAGRAEHVALPVVLRDDKDRTRADIVAEAMEEVRKTHLAYDVAKEKANAAVSNVNEALLSANRAQVALDTALTELKNTAPYGSKWNTPRKGESES